MATETFDIPGINTWVCPETVTSVLVKLTGSGADGVAGTINGSGRGGGGGSYSEKIVSVTPGVQYIINVPEHNSGSPATFNLDADVLAQADSANGITGGQASNCIGDTVHSGGDGVAGVSSPHSDGGGGGGAGTVNADGTNGSGTTGGTTGGGDGGPHATVSTDANGVSGLVPGGGGGGAGSID